MDVNVLAPVLTIVVSVGLGCLLALFPGGSRRLGGLIRTFAVAAALSVVVLHLVPHALHRVGLAGLAVVVAGYLATPLIERAVARSVRTGQLRGANVRLEAAFAALLVHRLGDGAAMAVGQRHGISLLLALGAHSIPVVTFVVIAFGKSRGMRHGLLRALGMAVASLVGVGVIEVFPSLTLGAAGGYVDAVVAGTLLHVVAHELRTDPPEGAGTKLVDFAAAVLGVATCVLPELAMHSGQEHVVHTHGAVGSAELAATALELGLEMAPLLLLGLLLAALLQGLAVHFPRGALRDRGVLGGALRGSVLSMLTPLCSCSVISISRSLGAGGVAPALVAAFLVATPELGLETLLVTGQLLGWPLAAARLGGALLLAVGAGLVVGVVVTRARRRAPLSAGPEPGARSTGGGARLDAAGDHDHDAPPRLTAGVIAQLAHVASEEKLARRFVHALDELVVHVGGWLAVGVAVATYLRCLVPESGLVFLNGSVSQLGVLTVVALPAYVCAPAATPVAAVLIEKGLGPGPVLAGVLLGSTLNLVGLRLLREMYGGRAALGVAVLAVAVTWSLGLGLDGIAGSLPWVAPGVQDPAGLAGIAHDHLAHAADHLAHAADETLLPPLAERPLAWGALGVLLVLGLRTSWQVGIRAWLANVFEPRHEGHAHVHVHAHCADSPSHEHEWEQWHAHEHSDAGDSA